MTPTKIDSPISPPLSEETEQKKPVDTAQLRELSTFGASMGIGGKFLREICDEIDSLRAQVASSPPGHQTLPDTQRLERLMNLEPKQILQVRSTWIRSPLWDYPEKRLEALQDAIDYCLDIFSTTPPSDVL